MRQRIDGIETRKRIVQAACQVFAEEGFRDTTVAEICRRAEANSAAVNYHFRDKESLYIAVWQHAAEEANRLYPMDGGVPPDAPAEQRFRGFILALLKRTMDRGRLGYFQRIRVMEMANPTGIIDKVRWQVIKPYREFTQQLLRALLGPEAKERDVEYCEISIVGPCLMTHLGATTKPPRGIPVLNEDEVTAFGDRFVLFALAGIKAIRRKIEAEAT